MSQNYVDVLSSVVNPERFFLGEALQWILLNFNYSVTFLQKRWCIQLFIIPQIHRIKPSFPSRTCWRYVGEVIKTLPSWDIYYSYYKEGYNTFRIQQIVSDCKKPRQMSPSVVIV